MTRERITDPTSGFQALNRKAIALFAADYPHDYPEVEAIVLVERHRLRLIEVPIAMRPRDGRTLVDPDALVRLLHGQGAARALRRLVPPLLDATGGEMTPLNVSIAASIASVVLLLVVFELIRSRRLRERYALLWLLTGVVLLVLSAWRGGLNTIADWVGVETYPPAILFAVASLFILAVLLHYSTVISKLSDQNSILAQRLALLEERVTGSARRTRAPARDTRRPCARALREAASSPRSPKQLARARRVDAAARLSVRLRRVPPDASLESRHARDELGEVADRDLLAGAEVHRLGRVVAIRREHEPLDAVVDVEELARRRAVAPEHDLLRRVDHLADQIRDHVRVRRVEAVARPVEIRRQQEDRVEPVLLPV